MADDRVRKLAEDALNHLTAELEAGKSQVLENYLATMGRIVGGNRLRMDAEREGDSLSER